MRTKLSVMEPLKNDEMRCVGLRENRRRMRNTLRIFSKETRADRVFQRFLIVILSLLSAETAFAEMELFVSDNCSHCHKLQQEITASELDRKFKIQTYEIYNDEGNRDYYIYKARQLDYKNAQVPLLIDGGMYKEGTSAILEYLENKEQGDYEPGSSSGLDENDSKKLNELIKAHVEGPLTEAVPPVPKSVPPVEPDLAKINDDSRTIKIWGLIIIIFGLTFFGAIIWRAKKKPHSN